MILSDTIIENNSLILENLISNATSDWSAPSSGYALYTMYYSKKGFPIKSFELSKEDAYEGISELLSRFELIPGVSDILDINVFRSSILDDLVLTSDGVSKK